MTKSRVFFALLLIGTAFWGISFPVTKDSFSVIHPFTFLLYRFLIAAVVLNFIFNKQLSLISKQGIKYGLLAGIPLGLAILLHTVGLKYTSSSNASFIAGIEVLLIPLLKLFFFKKRVQPKMWLACTLALVGLYVIAMTSSTGFAIGDLYVFIGSIFFSLYVLLVSKLKDKTEAFSFVIVQLYTCAAFYAVLTVATLGPSALYVPMQEDVWTALLFTGVLATAYMYCVQNIAQKHIEEEKIALAYLSEPIFATVAAYFMINEEITMRTIVGGLLILSAMFIAEANISKIKPGLFSYRRMKSEEKACGE